MHSVTRENKLVLQIRNGGLGDHLFYSHIPRIAKETGRYQKVYISNFSEFRHPDYKKLIWEKNPYVDGSIYEKGVDEIICAEESSDKNILDMIMLGLGLDDSQRFHEPEIYFKPYFKKELADKSVYDPNYVSLVGYFESNLEKWFRQSGIIIDYQMALRDRSIPIQSYRQILQSNNLEDFCSIIVSCKQLYCLTSGTATLAAALGKPATAFYGRGQKSIFHHSKIHKYVFIPELFMERIKRRYHKLMSRLVE